MSEITVPEQAHLSDLFENGTDVLISHPGKPQITVWIERPNPDQHEECMRMARSDRARRYYDLMDEGSAEMLALNQEMDAMDKEEVVQALIDKDSRSIERQALNEVLFSEDYGSDWGSEGEKWSAVLDGLSARFEEIEQHNKELEAAKAESGLISIDRDKEISRLSKIQEKFESEVVVRREVLREDRRGEIAVSRIDVLKKDLIKQRVDLECDLIWFATFKYEQLYRAVRYPGDHTALYFKNSSQIKALPNIVQEQLMDGLNKVDIDAEALKNSLTPLPS